MNSCPCCSNQLLRHIRHHQIYWFCTNCWQEMPNLELFIEKRTSLRHSHQPYNNQVLSLAASKP